MFAAIGEWVQEALMGLLLGLDGIIYTFVNWIYQIILVIADQNIFGDSNIMNSFIQRIYVILGVVMMFILAYSLLKSMINPEELTKGKQSPTKIITNVIIAIAIIALTPTVFNFAMQFQSALLKENTIGKIIVGSSTGDEANTRISQGGREMAVGVLNAFIFPSDNSYCKSYAEEQSALEGTTECEVIEIGNTSYGQIMSSAVDTNLVTTLPQLSSEMAGENHKLTYYWGISTVCGVIVVFVLASICIEVAIRMIKLAVFQFMAPIPAIARVIPNEQSKKVFDNWIKVTISTYLEIFIYLAILFFGVFMISIIREQIENGNLLGALFNSSNPVLGFIAQAFIILGIVLFIKDAPKLLKEITGLDSGKFGKAFVRGIGMMGATFGGGATAAIRRNVTDKKEHPEMGKGQRVARTVSALGGGMRRGLWQGGKVSKLGDIPKAAGTTATNTLNAKKQKETAGGFFPYMEEKIGYTTSQIKNWAGGSFDAQQQMLNEVNAFLKDAKAVKSTTEGLVRDKKYLFKMGETHDYGNGIQVNGNETLSEIESMITTLKNSGDIENAKIAARIESDMNKRIKKIGVQMQSLSTQNFADSQIRATFNNNYMADGFDIYKEASPTLSTAKSQIDIVNQKMQKNSSLEAVVNFQKLRDDNGNPLVFEENISKLADELEKQSATLSQQITLEQERRKANSKGGKDK